MKSIGLWRVNSVQNFAQTVLTSVTNLIPLFKVFRMPVFVHSTSLHNKMGSNMYLSELTHMGEKFSSAEKCYQIRRIEAAKLEMPKRGAIHLLPMADNVLAQMRQTDDPFRIKSLANEFKRRYPAWNRVWDGYRWCVMVGIQFAKYHQSLPCYEWLEGTGNEQIYEANKYDKYWGTARSLREMEVDGLRPQNGAQNMMGKILVMIRNFRRGGPVPKHVIGSGDSMIRPLSLLDYPKLFNTCLSGAKSTAILWHAQALANPLVEAMVLTFPTNDLVRTKNGPRYKDGSPVPVPPKKVLNKMKWGILSVLEEDSNLKLILVDTFRRFCDRKTDGSGKPSRIERNVEKVNTGLREMVQKFHPVLRERVIRLDTSSFVRGDFAPNSLHLNHTGCHKFRQIVAEILRTAL